MKHFYSKNVKKIHSNSQPLWRINCWQNLNQISPTAWTGSKHMTLWEGVTKMTCIRTLFSEIFFNLANLSPFSIFCPISQFNDTFKWEISRKSEDVMLGSNCHHQVANSWPILQDSDVQRWVQYHSAIQGPLWGDSCLRGCKFESQYCILYGLFFTFVTCIIGSLFEKRPKINKTRPGIDL